MGAVFCHHDAPIARIKALADDLAGHLKALKAETGADGQQAGRNGKAETLFLIEVLESFDHVGRDVGAHLLSRVPEGIRCALRSVERDAFCAMDAEELALLRNAALALAAGAGGAVSRGRLRQAAHALHYAQAPGARFRDGAWTVFIDETQALLAGDAAAAAKKFGAGRFFVLLENYWDYLVPMRADAAAATAPRATTAGAAP